MVDFDILVLGVDRHLFNRLREAAFLSDRKSSCGLNAGSTGLLHQINGFFTGKYAAGAKYRNIQLTVFHEFNDIFDDILQLEIFPIFSKT